MKIDFRRQDASGKVAENDFWADLGQRELQVDYALRAWVGARRTQASWRPLRVVGATRSLRARDVHSGDEPACSEA